LLCTTVGLIHFIIIAIVVVVVVINIILVARKNFTNIFIVYFLLRGSVSKTKTFVILNSILNNIEFCQLFRRRIYKYKLGLL